ncbi:hypothetical protein FVEG_08315 [Fusarium verticillioides 7600]|uniref:Uncharacterized protein n=1 Tax=Gibberella moniliformis (strain M3125 / FGSC 7600) TaxID=334819 RepID=W7MM34_GIBM7|nr:hypothetical protein FVEG_08315 [Fusarium verticillioides 7600]EWG48610.1 hypothetical protein FVEG_08315 [Fusarium verticillioides 7600]
MPTKRMRGTKFLEGMEQEIMFTVPNRGSHSNRVSPPYETAAQIIPNSFISGSDATIDEPARRAYRYWLRVKRFQHSQAVNRAEVLESPQNVVDMQSLDVLKLDDGMDIDMGDGFHLLEDQGRDLPEAINLSGPHRQQKLHIVEQLLAGIAASKEQIASLRQRSHF